MPRSPTVSSLMVHNLKNYVLGLGLDFDSICQTAALDPNARCFSDPEARLPALEYQLLFREAEKAAQDPCFGLNFGREMARSYPGGSVLINMMMNSPTVGEALDRFFRYHDLMADVLRPCMRIDGEVARLGWKTEIPGFRPPRAIAETLLSFFAGILEFLGQGRIRLKETRFQYPEPGDCGPYEDRFAAPLVFNAPKSEVIISAQDLSLPVAMANPALLQRLESFAQSLLHRVYFSQTWAHKTAEIITSRLVRGASFDVNAAAKDLGVGVRSLQARLKEESTTYREILDYVRKEAALQYLQKGEMTLCDIAFLLGFSEQSAFNRAFKRWTGKSPKSVL
ncbi:AraC family transcriptional regulator [Desulfatibacillum aliphaticivorans]|uniref:AraC family transcriptional regulator n=1 Tax=Desulfatibacillum aliphaticivorans TaxID=218208 RepID=UPI000413C060|nr:AraC family transcriptional regulator [Desulfatibacillum aliphaticivorans]